VNWRKFARQVSRAGVLSGALAIVVSLVLAPGEPHEHARLALYGALWLFPHAVAIAYIASSGKSRGVVAAGIMGLVTLPALAVPWLPLAGAEVVARWLLVAVSAVGVVVPLVVAAERGGSLRLSMVLISLSYIYTVSVSAYWLVEGWPSLFSVYALSILLAYPVPLIYAVTSHSLPATFGDKPLAPVAVLASLLSGAAGMMVASGSMRLAALLAGISVALYVVGSGVSRVGEYFSVAREKTGGQGKAYEGMAYYLWGHVFVIITVIIIFIMTIYAFSTGLTGRRLILLMIHMYALGFSWMHVAIHAPMMLPVILGVRHAMRYNLAPYILDLLALVLWPWTGGAALALVMASLVTMALIFLKI